MTKPSLAVAFATIERPQVVQRLIRSTRRYFPDIPIYVADQSRQTETMASFYASHDVRVIRMPYDAGVTASRNRLTRTIREDYFVLCDDDFVFGAKTRFDDALRILEAAPDIAVVGGRLYDFDGEREWARNWELYLQYDRPNKLLLTVPIYELAPRVRELSGTRYYLCDAVLNFALFRRSIFEQGISWDEQFKSNGEHEDFYLNLKLNSDYRVAYLPTMYAYHHHPEEYRAYRAKLRDRNDGWTKFLKKWGLEQHLELGLGVRTITDVDTIVGLEDARSRFFVNGDLCLGREGATPNSLLVNGVDEIHTIGALDTQGDRIADDGPRGRLLLDPSTRKLVVVPRTPPADLESPGKPTTESALDKYRLEASGRLQAVSSTDRTVHFRFDAVLRTDSDFFLWYRSEEAEAARPRGGERLAVTVRWSAADGRILIWRSRQAFLELEPRRGDYWRPLHLDVPVLPRDTAWLRFDVLTGGDSRIDPICTGFLFRAGNTPRRPGTGGDPLVFETLALSRLPNDGATRTSGGRLLEDIGRSCPVRSAALHATAPIREMSVLRIDEADDLEALYFVGWESLGRPLVGARLPARRSEAPLSIALPGTRWRPAQARLFGFGQAAGLVALTIGEGPEPAQP